MSLGIIIPCFNEADRLNLNGFKKCLETYHDFQLCFVNDGSSDNTLSILSKFQNEFKKRVTVIDIKKNKGKASAIRVGSRYLYSLKNIKYVGYLDIDLSKGFDELNELVENLKIDKKLIMFFSARNKDNKRNLFFK